MKDIENEALTTPGAAEHAHRTVVFINRNKFELTVATQTGRTLKELAGIALTDVLFLQQPGEDLVIPNEAEVTLKNGDHLFSQPPANYGSAAADEPTAAHPILAGLVGGEVQPQPNGWVFVTFPGYQLPHGYQPRTVRLLVKLPPLFPEAQPDMFWVSPPVRTAAGLSPNGTSTETVLGAPWQRFSWHLQPGAWKPGVSDLRDYMRCVRSRFERRD